MRVQNLTHQFELLQQEKVESMSDYFNQILAVVNQLKTNREKIEDKQVVKKVLRSLTAKFNYIVAAITKSKDLFQLSVDELMGSLQVHEQQLLEKTESTMELALQG
ncbi:uncharacterized protein [Aristolochia californica]|uniref:uncharacterized protein n=1 Tax=Aristolochia californica TaxID=171875 RepID=UPI0035D6BEB0